MENDVIDLDNQQDDDLLSLSDDDIMNMNSAPLMEGSAAPAQEENQEEGNQEENPETTAEKNPNDAPEEEDTQQEDSPTKETGSKEPELDAEGNPVEVEQEEEESKKTEEDTPQEVDFDAIGRELMGSFKANGKEIKINTPAEARQLMQMGANYTKKMQALKPHLRTIQTLEDNGITDPEQLSYLLDLKNKNPQAIQKLIKESGIDPLDIDSEANVDYKPTNYTVSEENFNFRQVVADIISEPEGQEVIQDMRKQWDAKSKEAAYNQPEVLRHLAEQKKSGIFQIIHAEVERQTMLGNLQDVSYLDAYYHIGNALNQQGKLVAGNQTKVVETRTDVPKAKVINSDKAKAATPNKSTVSKTVKQDFNPLAMSDDEFLNSPLAKSL